MSLKAGIVGLPNVGKSTLFNAITKKNILIANYPFATIEPNVGVVSVPDERVMKLSKMYEPKETIPTTFEFTDIAGLVKGASKGEGLGNKFLAHIREVDAIVSVVRCFDDSDITHVAGDVDPIRDIEIINIELIFADLETIENRINRMGKKVELTKEKDKLIEFKMLKKVQEVLLENIPLREKEWEQNEYKLLKNFNLITLKPIIYVANVNEEDAVAGTNSYIELIKDYINQSPIIMSAKIESELSELNNEEKGKFLDSLGIKDSGLDKLIFATYSLLGLETFFTVGKDEVRAWTFSKGMKAPECARIIHTDFQRGFIKAEVMSYDDLVNLGSEKNVKDAGKLRLEGKDYVMKDGDICCFRFNV